VYKYSSPATHFPIVLAVMCSGWKLRIFVLS